MYACILSMCLLEAMLEYSESGKYTKRMLFVNLDYAECFSNLVLPSAQSANQIKRLIGLILSGLFILLFTHQLTL